MEIEHSYIRDIPGGEDFRVVQDHELALQVERYPDQFSAYWRTNLLLSSFVQTMELITTIPPDTIFTIGGTADYIELSYSDFSRSIPGLHQNVTFLRMNMEKSSVTWHYEEDEIGKYKYIGFIAVIDFEDLDMITKLYMKTATLAEHIDAYEETLNVLKIILKRE